MMVYFLFALFNHKRNKHKLNYQMSRKGSAMSAHGIYIFRMCRCRRDTLPFIVLCVDVFEICPTVIKLQH